MKRKKPKFIPGLVSSKPGLGLKPIPVSANGEPRPEPKFLPVVALSYESTLEMKPIPVSVSAEDECKERKAAKGRSTKASLMTRAPKETAASAKARSAKANAKKRAHQGAKGT